MDRKLLKGLIKGKLNNPYSGMDKKYPWVTPGWPLFLRRERIDPSRVSNTTELAKWLTQAPKTDTSTEPRLHKELYERNETKINVILNNSRISTQAPNLGYIKNCTNVTRRKLT